MKLELLSLRAVNCGPLRDVRIDFSDGQGHARPITLLAGANGSGKTTALELIAALASLLSDDFDPRSSLLQQAEYAQIDLIIGEHLIGLYYGRFPDDKDLPRNFYGAGTYEELSFLRSERKLINPVAQDFKELIAFASKGTMDSIAPADRGEINSTPCVIFFPYLRELSRVEGQQITKAYTNYEWVHRYQPETDYIGSLSSYLIWLEYAEPEAYVRVQTFLNGLFPDHKRFDVERRQLKGIVTTQDGKKHDLDALSSGEQNLLIVLLELHRRIVPGSVVLIDEIENSLHPAFQHRMAQGLLRLQREVPFQLIVTSHAEDIYKVFGAKSTLVLPMPNYA